MNTYILAAGIIMMLLAVIHSVLGERLIFRHVSPGTPLGQTARTVLSERRWRALRATWHLISILSAGLSLCAGVAAVRGAAVTVEPAVIMAGTFVVMGVYWLLETRGGHPAWIAFLLIAVLMGLGATVA